MPRRWCGRGRRPCRRSRHRSADPLKEGFWLAIPTEAAGRSLRGGKITPGEWEHRRGCACVSSIGVAAPACWWLTGTDEYAGSGGSVASKAGRGQGTAPIVQLVPPIKLPKPLDQAGDERKRSGRAVIVNCVAPNMHCVAVPKAPRRSGACSGQFGEQHRCFVRQRRQFDIRLAGWPSAAASLGPRLDGAANVIGLLDGDTAEMTGQRSERLPSAEVTAFSAASAKRLSP